THVPGQFAYNSVEHSMSTLSGKLAGIVLPIDHFGSHLNSSGIINDTELANKNFHYASEKAEEAAALLAKNEGFLLSATKGQD
ncbi:29541_t:CDS:2, partial [Gigaspora margarita]